MFRPFRQFTADRRGNVSLMFGLTLIPMLGAAGAAIDYSRMSSTRTAVLAAADAGALAGAAVEGSEAERRQAAVNVFTSNIRQAAVPYPVRVTYENLREGRRNVGFRIEASARVPSLFGWVNGAREVDVPVVAQARSPELQDVELVFALDTTASMEGDRIVNLKSAVNMMLDDIQTRVTRPELLKVGVVPFAQYVNVGLSYRNAPWIDVPADYQTPVTTQCDTVYDQIGETNCRMVTYPAQPAQPPGVCMIDGRPRPCGGSPYVPERTERVCDPIYSPTPRTVCYPVGGHWVRWEGCVGSRSYPLNMRDSGYGVRIPGILGISCASPLMPLTNDIAAVRSMVNGLVTMGETYIPSGLMWGWRLLSSHEPFTASNSPTTTKILVLVTDGRNTRSPRYPDHEGADAAMADDLTREACRNIADDRPRRIKVFTVAFEMDGLATKAALEDCARRSGGQFFDAANPEQLRSAFRAIAGSISQVRLTQ